MRTSPRRVGASPTEFVIIDSVPQHDIEVDGQLAGHWNRNYSTDAEIWNHAPATFRFELTGHPAKREAELIQELKPSCNPVSHSRFPKFW